MVYLVNSLDKSQSEITDGVIIPVVGKLLDKAETNDEIQFTDTRGSLRTLKVIKATKNFCQCESQQTSYLTSGTVLTVHRGKKLIHQDHVGKVSPIAQFITLTPGSWLRVVRGDVLGQAAVFDEQGNVKEPAMVGCTLWEVFRDVRVNERIFFDDGKIQGIIREVKENEFRVEITSVVGGSAKLRGEKGINLPDTELNLPALTEKDRQDLAFIAQHSDMVAVSFVQRAKDIEALIQELPPSLGLVLKIETQKGFQNLPQILLTAMQHPLVAVMLARGDLGVEVGFERLSEVQEEILWLCEAAHVPVIWATQVLESLAKGGMASRAEVTDAAMGSRAECVMLNKGPYIHKAMQFLCDVLHRMQTHHEKRVATLRKLRIAQLEEV